MRNCSLMTLLLVPRCRAGYTDELDPKVAVAAEMMIVRILLLPGRSQSDGVGWGMTAVAERLGSVVRRVVTDR